MRLSPHYDWIRNRAFELLLSPNGFNGHSADEIATWGRTRHDFTSRNAVGVAVCRARDEVYAHIEKEHPSSRYLEASIRAFREARFGTGQFEKVMSEILRELKARAKSETASLRT